MGPETRGRSSVTVTAAGASQLPDIMPDGSRQFHKQPWGGAPAGWTGKAADKLPDYAMPPFDGIGANEYVVTAANGRC